jgi:hypothetical protein
MEPTNVNKEEFYKKIGPLDVCLSIINPHSYPYTTEFRMRNTRRLIGVTVDSYSEGGLHPIVTTYRLYQ